jgi:hypothetical protein
MKPRTLSALKKSIEHWTRLAEGKRQPNELTGPEHCALCGLFLEKDKHGKFCTGCPVKTETGHDTCYGTPYAAAESAGQDFGFDSLKFRRAARKELNFLKSLLPCQKS